MFNKVQAFATPHENPHSNPSLEDMANETLLSRSSLDSASTRALSPCDEDAPLAPSPLRHRCHLDPDEIATFHVAIPFFFFFLQLCGRNTSLVKFMF